MLKNHKTLSGVVAFALMAFVAFAACETPTDPNGGGGGGGGDTGTKNVPGKISAELPKSLTTSAGTSPSIASHTLGTSGAYEQIQSSITQMRSFLFSAAVQLVVVDALITQNNLSTSSNILSGYSVTISQEMVDVIKGLIPDSMVDELSGPGMLPSVGETYPMDDFYYRTTSESPYSLEFSQTMSDGNFSMELTLDWSQDKKKVLLKIASGSEFNISISYNDETKTSTMVSKVDSSGFSWSDTTQIKEDSANTAAHGVTLFFDQRYDLSGTILTYEAKGIADDNGGFLESTVDYDGDGYKTQEVFDGNGELLASAYSNDGGATWTGDTISSGYADDYAETDFDTIDDEFASDGLYYFTQTLPNGTVADDTYVAYAVMSGTLSASPTQDEVDALYLGDAYAYGESTGDDPLDIYFYYQAETPGTQVYLYEVDENWALVTPLASITVTLANQ